MQVIVEIDEREVLEMFSREDIHSMSDVDLVIKEQIINNLDIIENAEIRIVK